MRALRQRTIGRRQWIVGTLVCGGIQIAVPGSMTGLLAGHHRLILLTITAISMFSTGMLSFALTVKRLRDVGAPGWLASLMLVYCCPFLIIIGGVTSVFFYRPFLVYLAFFLVSGLIGYAFLGLMKGATQRSLSTKGR